MLIDHKRRIQGDFLRLLLAEQMKATLGCEGSDGSWQTVIALAPD